MAGHHPSKPINGACSAIAVREMKNKPQIILQLKGYSGR